MNEETLDANDETVYTPQLGASVNPEPELEEVGEGKPDEAADSADSSPDSEDNHEKITGVQKRINELTAKRYEEQRRADALEAKLKEIEAIKAQTQSAPTTIEAPVMPDDVYDSEAMAKYHKDMIAYSTKVAQQAASSTFEQQQQAQQQQAQEAAIKQAISTYAANAIKDGVNLEKVQAAENFLTQAGIKQELGHYLLNDPNGAKVVEYLGDNPAEAYELLALDPVTAGIKIATEIKPKALSTTPKVPRAPEPVPDIKGGGVSDKDDFERMFPGTEFI